MDGRVQYPALDWMKKKFTVDYVDSITEPGPIKILAENTDQIYIESIKRRVAISVNKHGSRNIAILGHYDCAGNPVEQATQIVQIKDSIKTVNSWGFPVNIIGLWVDDSWKVNEI